ncbi:MAG: dienelactone hydrolase family protein [Myxococcota bacterium]
MGLLRKAVCALFLLSCNGRAELVEHSMDWQGAKRIYEVHLPHGTRPESPAPVVLIFHGGGPLDADGERTGNYTSMSSKADREGFIAVYPRAREDNWNDGRDSPNLQEQKDNVDDVGFIRAVLDQLERDYPVDRKRIYATGLSNGGIFSFRLACELSDRITAIAPVIGAVAEPLAPRCAPTRPVPVLSLHGTRDGFVPIGGGTVTAPGTRQDRGKVLSADDSRKLWARLNGCTDDTTRSTQDKDPRDGTALERIEHVGCPESAPVKQLLLHGAGHTWPGARWYPYLGDVSYEVHAEDEIWSFFRNHALP